MGFVENTNAVMDFYQRLLEKNNLYPETRKRIEGILERKIREANLSPSERERDRRWRIE